MYTEPIVYVSIIKQFFYTLITVQKICFFKFLCAFLSWYISSLLFFFTVHRTVYFVNLIGKYFTDLYSHQF